MACHPPGHSSMHHLRPLMLPRLVATRKSSKSSLNVLDDPILSLSSSTDSAFSFSDYSTSPTPSLHMRGHIRFPSSTSSLSSSPPTHESTESPSASTKLPKLTEEPVEREVDYAVHEPCPYSYDMDAHAQECHIRRAYDPEEEEYFTYCDSELRQAKRLKPLDASAHGMTSKLERRFSAFSRKVRERSSTMSKPSRSAPPSMVPSTCSSSLAGSIHLPSTADLREDHSSSAPINKEAVESECQALVSINIDKANALHLDVDEVQAERYATTPLLPPLLVSCRPVDLPTSSPLQSPTIADTNHSLLPTPSDTPLVRAYPTPSLSSKPSIASFKAPRAGSAAEIPPMMLADPNDKWANLLGHANFTILPEPYVPEACDAGSVQQQFNDWVQAQHNYAKHQVRTAEHYGATSKYYLLSEQKWAEIHAQWRWNHDLAKAQAAAIGQAFASTSPVEPGPIRAMPMPMLNDLKNEGKFPKLGDEDIVGPMQQDAALLPPTPSRKRALFRFLGDLFAPRLGSIRGH